MIYKTKLHWSVMFWNIIYGCLLLALGGFLLYYPRTHAEIAVNNFYTMKIGAIFLIVAGFVLILVGNPQAKRIGNGSDEPARDHKKRPGKPNIDRDAA